jgi:uncharacterized repeat protein (TIGR02543 family)
VKRLILVICLIACLYACQNDNQNEETNNPSNPNQTVITEPIPSHPSDPTVIPTDPTLVPTDPTTDTEIPYMIHFDSMGGSMVSSIEVGQQLTIEKPEDPTKDGFVFMGWYESLDIASHQMITEVETITWPLNVELLTDDITLYALFIDFRENDDWEFTAVDSGYALTQYFGNDEHITIPKLYLGIPVVEIGYGLFSNSTSIKSIYISKYVTKISNYAFSRSELETITFEEDSMLHTIGARAFYLALDLQSITIPKTVTSIGDSAFYKAESLTEFVFEPGINLEHIPFDMLYGAGSILSIVIPRSVKTIGDSAFGDMTMLASVIFEEDSQLEVIGYGAFSLTKQLKTIIIPKSLTEISDYAFSRSGLETIIFEDNSMLHTIGLSAFYLANLKTITIPESVLNIGSNAFYKNDESMTIYIMHTQIPEGWHPNFNPTNYVVRLKDDE